MNYKSRTIWILFNITYKCLNDSKNRKINNLINTEIKVKHDIHVDRSKFKKININILSRWDILKKMQKKYKYVVINISKNDNYIHGLKSMQCELKIVISQKIISNCNNFTTIIILSKTKLSIY